MPRAATSSLQILGTVGVLRRPRALRSPEPLASIHLASPRRLARVASALQPRGARRPAPLPPRGFATLPPHMVRVPSPRYFSRAPDHRSPPDPFDRAHPVPPAPPTTPTTLRPPRRAGAPHPRSPHDDAREHRVVEDRGGREGDAGDVLADVETDKATMALESRRTVPRQDRRPGRRVRPPGRHRRRRHGRGRGGRRGVRELRRPEDDGRDE